MSLNFTNFMHFQIVKNRYILPTFCLNPVFYWLIFGSDQLGPIFYWLVLARSGFFETEFWLGLARSGFFEQTLWLGPDRSWKKSARPKPKFWMTCKLWPTTHSPIYWGHKLSNMTCFDKKNIFQIGWFPTHQKKSTPRELFFYSSRDVNYF